MGRDSCYANPDVRDEHMRVLTTHGLIAPLCHGVRNYGEVMK